MKTIHNLQDTLDKSTQKLNLIYQWVKSEEITFKQFNYLIKYVQEWEQKEFDRDGFN